MAKPAYTYIVGWLDRDVYYYGFRSHAKDKAPESDLWVDYKVSLKAYYENGGVHPMLGKKQSEESKKKMSDSLRGLVPWNLGVPHTDETRMKISIAVNRHYDKNRAVAQSTETLGE